MFNFFKNNRKIEELKIETKIQPTENEKRYTFSEYSGDYSEWTSPYSYCSYSYTEEEAIKRKEAFWAQPISDRVKAFIKKVDEDKYYTDGMYFSRKIIWQGNECLKFGEHTIPTNSLENKLIREAIERMTDRQIDLELGLCNKN